MSRTDFLYDFLPTIYRQTDLSRDTPLRALFAILQDQYDLLESDIATLYENWFVETCEPWALPYLAELLGADRPLRHDIGGVDARRLIANTLAYRRRKGVVTTIEHVVEDATGWPARIVEGSELVAMTETGRRLRPRAPGTVSMRDVASLDRLGGAFDGTGRTVEVRLNGVSNLDRVGIFLWRLQSYPMRAVTAAAVKGGPGRFTFHPLGRDMPLFNRRLGNYGIDRRNGTRNVPAPLTRRLLADELGRHQATRPLQDCFLFSEAPAFAIYLVDSKKPLDPDKPAPRQPLRPAELCIGDLSNWRQGATPKGARVVVDPELGRLMLLGEQDRQPGMRVITDHCYGFAGDVGGGPYFQPAKPFVAGDTPWRARVGGVPTDSGYFASLDLALRAWRETHEDGIIEIADSGTYQVVSGTSDPRQPNIVLDGDRRSLTIQAAPQQRPCIEGSFVIQAPTATSNAEVMLDGLLIGGAIHTRGAMQLTLRHSTLLPSDGGLAILAEQSEGLCVALKSAVTAAICLAADASELRISDSIVDGGDFHAVAGPEGSAKRHHGEPDELRRAGPLAIVERTTFVGRVVVSEIKASDTIFTAPLSVTRQHQGFVRHSYVAPGSRTPQRYECQPADPKPEDSAAAVDPAAGRFVRPKFTSLRRGHPGYAQFAPSCPRAISAGASNGAEMGAFHLIDDVRREDNLRDTLDEHLPIGYLPITIYVT